MSSYKGGYMGKILRVDLSTGRISDEALPGDDVLRKYVGCWGVGLRYLYDLLPSGYSAADPENPLIFMTGPLTGLPLPGATNITVATKNFNTGFTVGRSHSHGNFGILMKAAGYDGVIVTGKADKPVYLWLHDDRAELRDASHLWGKKDTHETEDAIKQELGNPKISVAAIGPCGENLVAGGMIMNDRYHGFSHSGVGSVMGSKKLKALALFGEKPIPIAAPGKLSLLNEECQKRVQAAGVMKSVGRQQSKKNELRFILARMGFAGKNFRISQMTDFGLGWGRHIFTSRPCPRCPIACPYDLEIATGPYKGYVATLSGGAEALEGAGSILGITEPGTPFYLTDVYDRLGIEGSMAGCTIAMAIEAYETGLINKKDTDGLELKWGDDKIAEALVKKMVHREGFGEVLAHGVKQAAELIGGNAPDFAVHVKGTALNLHEWRAVWGVLFGQIVGSGAGWPAPGVDCFRPEPDAGYLELTSGLDHCLKPMEARQTGILKFMNDCTGFCWFITWGMPGVLQLSADILSATTGWDYTREELLEVGERLMHLERAFNVRQGLIPKDDWNVPERLIGAPIDGPGKGASIKPYLKGMVEEYYRLMVWDEKTGKPWRRTLKRFGLDAEAEQLWGPEEDRR